MKAPSASPRWYRHPSFRQVSVLEADEGVGVFGELEDRKESEESSPALLTGIEATEAQRSAARHEKILFTILCFPLLTDTISNIYKDITLFGISQLGGLSNTQKKRSTAARDRSSRASSDAGPKLAGRESHCGDGTYGSKKPTRGPGPPASQAPPSSAEGGKSSRGQPCCQPHVAQPTNS